MSTEIIVTKDIPFIGSKSQGGRARIYPLAEMEVGDSFALPKEEATRVSAAMSYRGLKPKRFARRMVIENGVKVVRVWRIA